MKPRGVEQTLSRSETDHSGAASDAQLVTLWLETRRSVHTRRAYASDAQSLLTFLDQRERTLRTVSVRDIQAWMSSLTGAAASCARHMAAVKSLMSFGHRLGYLAFNVGSVLQAPRVLNTLAERILSEDEIRRLLSVKTSDRDRALLQFLYVTGARVSEACALQWKHVHPSHGGSVVVTLHGKGASTRHVMVPADVASTLGALRVQNTHDSMRISDVETPVFVSHRGVSLHPASVFRIVSRLARQAGLSHGVSPHWLRHAHASHALDRGAPISLVQATLGHSSLSTTGRYTHVRPNDGSGRYLSTRATVG